MGNGFAFLDIVLFAAVAAFLVLRLRSVLGRRTGHDQPTKHGPLPRDSQKGADSSGEETSPQLADRSKPVADLAEFRDYADNSQIRAGLAQIRMADRSFNLDQFQSGAKQAFEMIISAFSDGDMETLRPLLSNDVYEDFCGAIKARQKEGHVLETTLVGVDKCEIVEAEVQGRTAFITVRFVSEQTNVLRDGQGNPIDGEPNKANHITDVWTFARNTRSRDPNWTLVATSSPQ